MKKIVLALTLSLSTSALATPMSEHCPTIAEVARLTMDGVPMRTLMELDNTSLSVTIITEAYEHPAYSTQEFKDKVIQDFEDMWYLKCVKAYNQ